jgi:hypothetical protein
MIQKCMKGLVFMLLFTISWYGIYVIIQKGDKFESVKVMKTNDRRWSGL